MAVPLTGVITPTPISTTGTTICFTVPSAQPGPAGGVGPQGPPGPPITGLRYLAPNLLLSVPFIGDNGANDPLRFGVMTDGNALSISTLNGIYSGGTFGPTQYQNQTVKITGTAPGGHQCFILFPNVAGWTKFVDGSQANLTQASSVMLAVNYPGLLVPPGWITQMTEVTPGMSFWVTFDGTVLRYFPVPSHVRGIYATASNQSAVSFGYTFNRGVPFASNGNICSVNITVGGNGSDSLIITVGSNPIAIGLGPGTYPAIMQYRVLVDGNQQFIDSVQIPTSGYSTSYNRTFVVSNVTAGSHFVALQMQCVNNDVTVEDSANGSGPDTLLVQATNG